MIVLVAQFETPIFLVSKRKDKKIDFEAYNRKYAACKVHNRFRHFGGLLCQSLRNDVIYHAFPLSCSFNHLFIHSFMLVFFLQEQDKRKLGKELEEAKSNFNGLFTTQFTS